MASEESRWWSIMDIMSLVKRGRSRSLILVLLSSPMVTREVGALVLLSTAYGPRSEIHMKEDRTSTD